MTYRRVARRANACAFALTAEGEPVLVQVWPAMQRAQERILAPLSKGERATFMRLLRTLVTENNEHIRAPRE